MILTFTTDDDGATVLLMDLEGMAYLVQGIEQLADGASEVESPALRDDDESDDIGVTAVRLRRVE